MAYEGSVREGIVNYFGNPFDFTQILRFMKLIASVHSVSKWLIPKMDLRVVILRLP